SALAYTVGQNVVFGTGQYTPRVERGQRLLAHELAHTIQQRNVSMATSELFMPSVAEERQWEGEANWAAEFASRAPLAQVSTPRLQRQASPDSAYNIQLTYPPN